MESTTAAPSTESASEKWRDVVGFEGFYEVSSYGRVRSLDREVLCGYGKTRKLKGKILALNPNSKGYPRVGLCKDDKSRFHFVHRLVAAAFVDNPLNLPWINHLNGDKADNRPDNLEWCTPNQNSQHALAQGLYKVGEEHHVSKFTRDQALMVLGALRCGVRQQIIAEQLGVTPWFVTSIATGKSMYL